MNTGPDLSTPEEVVSFWYSQPVKAKWFEPDSAFDAELKARLEPSVQSARSGELISWAQEARSILALIILLDQIPRNIYRNSPDAFASDRMALDLARHAVRQGFDSGLNVEERQFLYMPFMHSESLEDQDEGLALFSDLGLEEPLRFMQKHRDVIVRFGRFPHRNSILGRQSTQEELAFLEQPGSRF